MYVDTLILQNGDLSYRSLSCFLQSCNTPTTPSYSQSLELEHRMLDGSTMVTIPTHVPPLQATVISTGPTADCSRHIVCQPGGRPRPELQHHHPQATIANIMPGPSKAGGKSKMRASSDDPCHIAPLKKRKIHVSKSSSEYNL